MPTVSYSLSERGLQAEEFTNKQFTGKSFQPGGLVV